jgi:hypothetical protein
MTPEDLDFIEKVKIPEYVSYGWVNACEDLRKVIQSHRALSTKYKELEERNKLFEGDGE